MGLQYSCCCDHEKQLNGFEINSPLPQALIKDKLQLFKQKHRRYSNTLSHSDLQKDQFRKKILQSQKIIEINKTQEEQTELTRQQTMQQPTNIKDSMNLQGKLWYETKFKQIEQKKKAKQSEIKFQRKNVGQKEIEKKLAQQTISITSKKDVRQKQGFKKD